jgi:hypothetical protein
LSSTLVFCSTISIAFLNGEKFILSFLNICTGYCFKAALAEMLKQEPTFDPLSSADNGSITGVFLPFFGFLGVACPLLGFFLLFLFLGTSSYPADSSLEESSSRSTSSPSCLVSHRDGEGEVLWSPNPLSSLLVLLSTDLLLCRASC